MRIKQASKLIRILIPALISFLFFSTSISYGQVDIDLSSPSFEPSVLLEAAQKQNGQFKFRINKPVNTDIPVHGFKLKIEMSNLKPLDGINSISGSAAQLFKWEYNEEENVFLGTQSNKIIGFLYSGEIAVDFEVTADSAVEEPKNGFQATIFDLMEKYDIVKKNNNLSIYTWTRAEIRP